MQLLEFIPCVFGFEFHETRYPVRSFPEKVFPQGLCPILNLSSKMERSTFYILRN